MSQKGNSRRWVRAGPRASGGGRGGRARCLPRPPRATSARSGASRAGLRLTAETHDRCGPGAASAPISAHELGEACRLFDDRPGGRHERYGGFCGLERELFPKLRPLLFECLGVCERDLLADRSEVFQRVKRLRFGCTLLKATKLLACFVTARVLAELKDGLPGQAPTFGTRIDSA